MKQKKYRRKGALKFLLIVPLILLFGILNSPASDFILEEEPETKIYLSSFNREANDTILETAEKMPEYPGGLDALLKYLSQNVKYPQNAIKNNIEGTVISKFIVTKDGTIKDIQVVKSTDDELDKEAVRVIQNMPPWQPGENEGEVVDVQYTLPIRFALPTEEIKALAPRMRDSNDVFRIVDDMPVFPGGLNDLYRFLAENIKYPEEAHKNNEEGRVIIQYIVTETGEIEDINILRGVSESIDQEAIRIVESMPNWIPGKHKGKTVAVKYTLPINFKLSNEKNKTEDPKPVIVVDGNIMEENFDVNSIAVDNIESMNVLKPFDQSEEERLILKYGERAKNGVIEIITLK